MQCIPAIDLYASKVVRLYQGDFKQTTEYAISPIELMQKYEREGAKVLHLVDLIGAQRGVSNQQRLIREIVHHSKLEIQMGGGIRTGEMLSCYLDCGVQRVVLGSIAMSQPLQVQEWLNKWGTQRIMLALDLMLDEKQVPWVVAQGWQQQTSQSLWDAVAQYQQFEALTVLCTDISRDGCLNGPNIELYAQCRKRFPQIKWQASGGIASLRDLAQLKALGMEAAIIGKALLEQRFTLAEALNIC